MKIDEGFLDRIALTVKSADCLNAIHACRNGHPLNNEMQWRNAYFSVKCQPYNFHGNPAHQDMAKLKFMAETEAQA